jgi:hypothetical protein
MKLPQTGGCQCGKIRYAGHSALPSRKPTSVRSGTLDDTSWLRPTVHFWTRSKQPWIMLPEGDQSFETQPAT